MINETRIKLESKHYYLLLGVIGFFVLLQSLLFLEKQNFVTDEELTILLAVGKLSNYSDMITSRKYPYGELVDVQEYKDWFKIDKKFCFGKIAKDSASLDIHPPLYLWLLHIWIILTGGKAYIWTGNLLNLFLFMFIIIALFKLASECFCSFEDALFSVILFSLSPMVYDLSQAARPYLLLTLIVILNSYFLQKIFIKENKSLNLFSLLYFSVLICLGFLCHYTFILICFAWFIFIFTTFWKTNKKFILFFLIACLIGFLFFCNIFPGFINNLRNYKIITQETLNNSFLSELHKLPLDLKISKIILQRLASIFSEHQRVLIAFTLMLGKWFRYIFVSTIIFLLFWIWFSIKKNKLFSFIFASFFYPSIFIALYVLNAKSLSWCININTRYFLFILPFFYLCIIFFLKKTFGNCKSIILVCLCQILLFSVVDNIIVGSQEYIKLSNRRSAFLGYFQEMQDLYKNKIVIFDNSSIHHWDWRVDRLFKVIHTFPEGTKIIMASADYFLTHYPKYFGSETKLSPLIYVAYFDDERIETKANRDLLKEIENDENLEIALEPIFSNLTGTGEVVFTIMRRDQTQH